MAPFAVLFAVLFPAWVGRTDETREIVRAAVPDDSSESYRRLCLDEEALVVG